MGLSPPVVIIHRFVENELARLEAILPQPDARTTQLPQLNALFQAVLKEPGAPAPLPAPR